jgi:hypothetical protein
VPWLIGAPHATLLRNGEEESGLISTWDVPDGRLEVRRRPRRTPQVVTRAAARAAPHQALGIEIVRSIRILFSTLDSISQQIGVTKTLALFSLLFQLFFVRDHLFDPPTICFSVVVIKRSDFKKTLLSRVRVVFNTRVFTSWIFFHCFSFLFPNV